MAPARLSHLGALLLASTAPLAGSAQEAAEPPDDDRVRRAWSYLLPDEQREAIEWLRLEVSVMETFQLQCLRYVVENADRDAGFWPDQPPMPFFDPDEHAPAQPIARRRLDPDGSTARRFVGEVEKTRPPRRLRSAWSYDWATGMLSRGADVEDPERIFENALAGFPPEADLAEALVLRTLDTGEARLALGAFAHAYTDRQGNVFPCSLYEAWSSGVEIEMPDVDTLGIVHDALDEWRKWKAPVAPSKHKSLYGTIGDVFAEARRYRGLREALASVYLTGEPVMRDGYGESRIRFHSLWDKHRSVPPPVGDALPRDPEEWTDFLAEWATTVQRDRELRAAGKRRGEQLAADGARVRATLVWVLEQLGAFERKARPKPKPKPKAPQPEDG